MKNELSKLIITETCALNRVSLASGSKNVRNNREHNAFAYKVKGRTVYTVDGKNYVSDSKHVILLPKGLAYSFHCEEFGVCLMVEFETSVATFDTIQSFKINNPSEIYGLLDRMERNWTFQKTGYTAFCLSGIYQLIYKMEQQQEIPYALQKKMDCIRPSLSFLEENYSNPTLNSAQLAQLSGISEIYFRKLFTAIFGIPPKRYINTIRITKAKELLRSDYSFVLDVAESVGFSDIYHFYKVFKASTGCTPTEYAKRDQ
jgi:AraC-type DNA-binding domain-containing proteins